MYGGEVYKQTGKQIENGEVGRALDCIWSLRFTQQMKMIDICTFIKTQQHQILLHWMCSKGSELIKD